MTGIYFNDLKSYKMLLNSSAREKPEVFLGKTVTVAVDRPKGSFHPEHKDMYYPINYGYVKGIFAPDGEEQDVYILGADKPLSEAECKIIAVIHRLDDIEDKWVGALDGMTFTKEEIIKETYFAEKYFHSEIFM